MREFSERRTRDADESAAERNRRVERDMMRRVMRPQSETSPLPEAQMTEPERLAEAARRRMERLRLQRLNEGIDEGQFAERKESMTRPHLLRTIDNLLLAMKETHQNWNMFEAKLASREVYEASRVGARGIPENFSAWPTMAVLISLKIQGAVKKKGLLATRRMMASIHNVEDLLRIS